MGTINGLNCLFSLPQYRKIEIGPEATRHYGTNLKFFNRKQHFCFMEFNPNLSE